jgi:hypothetical protein
MAQPRLIDTDFACMNSLLLFPSSNRRRVICEQISRGTLGNYAANLEG